MPVLLPVGCGTYPYSQPFETPFQRLEVFVSLFTPPLCVDELRAIKAWLGDRKKKAPETDAFFITERRTPLSRKTAWVAIRDYGEKAGLAVAAHPHMLRHACGFALADQGAETHLIQDYLGHRNIQHTVIYTATNPARFEKLWR